MQKKILITGATGGIGSALAHALAPNFELILAGRNAQKLDDLCAELPHAQPLVLDLGQPDKLILPELNSLDGLVLNAAVLTHGAVSDMPLSEWETVFKTNLFSATVLLRQYFPALRKAKGQIIFVNSIGGLRMHAGWAVYGGSKYALHALADAVRTEETKNGVRVSTIFPGRTATPMMQAVRQHENGEYQAESYIDPKTIASAIQFMLQAPKEANIAEMTVIPAKQERI